MARLEYFLRETASGLRRNGIVAFAAMSTAFIALFLFGLSLLIYREFNLVIQNLTGNVEVAGSRLPVGSSARRISGRFTNARAIETRCCSPPDSSCG